MARRNGSIQITVDSIEDLKIVHKALLDARRACTNSDQAAGSQEHITLALYERTIANKIYGITREVV